MITARNAQTRSMRGFTLIEMLMVVVIIGIMLRFGLPYFRSSNTKADVRGAMDAIAAMHNLSKTQAVIRGRVTRLVIDRAAGTVVTVSNKVTGTGVDTVGRVQSLFSRFGVTISSSPTRDTLTFTPRGLGTEAGDTKIIVTKGSFVDTLIASPAGRLIR
jgi:prepilin-type N-terminal cleavage/methylation domain-containing protein